MQENNKIEIKRFDKERRRDFIEMLKGFVVNQVRVLHCSAKKNTMNIPISLVHVLTKGNATDAITWLTA
jgi:hypothetical protein